MQESAILNSGNDDIYVDIREMANKLYQIARVSEKKGEIVKALDTYEQSLEIWEQIGDPKWIALVLYKVANLKSEIGDIKDALGLWEKAIKLYAKIGDVKGKADVFYAIGRLKAKNSIEPAIEVYKQAIKLYEECGDIYGKLASLNRMAALVYVKAVHGQGLLEALEIFGQAYDLNDQLDNMNAKAYILSALASLKGQQGELQDAIKLLGEAYILYDRIKDKNGKARALYLIAGIKAGIGKTKDALELLEYCIDLSREVGDTRLEATIIHATTYVRTLYNEVDMLNQNLSRGSAESIDKSNIDVIHNTADLNVYFGHVEEAIRLCSESLKLHRKRNNRLGELKLLRKIAALKKKQRKFDEALELYEQSLEILNQIGEEHNKASIMYEIATVKLLCGNSTEALDLYIRSLETN